MKYTGNLLITAIERNGSFPTSQNLLSNNNLLDFCNEELQITIAPEIMALQQNYFTDHSDIALTASTEVYSMPSSAVGWGLQDIGHVDENGENYRTLPRLNIENRDIHNNDRETNEPEGFYLLGNGKFEVSPQMSSSPTGSVRVWYSRRQNQIVKTASCGLISSVTATDTYYVCTVNAIPNNDSGVDLISGTSPFNVLASGATPVVSGFNLSLLITDCDRAPVAGDYVAPFGKTPIPNLPETYHPIIAQAATVRALESIGDLKGLSAAQSTLQRMISYMKRTLSNRVSGAPVKIVAKSHFLNYMR